jgi:hypothetical protein
MKRDPHRVAWTAHIEGTKSTVNKYGNERTKEFDSKREAEYVTNLDALLRAGKIKDLRLQVPVELVPGNGKLRPIVWIADAVYFDEDGVHYVDVKGCKTQVYRLKKRLAALLKGIKIEEV